MGSSEQTVRVDTDNMRLPSSLGCSLSCSVLLILMFHTFLNMFSLIVVLLLLPLWNNILLQHISFPLYQVASGLSSVFLFINIIALSGFLKNKPCCLRLWLISYGLLILANIALLFCIYFTDYANIATYTSMVTFLLLLVTSFLRVRLHWSVVSSAKRLEEEISKDCLPLYEELEGGLPLYDPVTMDRGGTTQDVYV